jgi:hypothetical protein
MEIRDHCEVLAAECEALGTQPEISIERAATLAHIANSWMILAYLYEKLSVIVKKESN